MNKELLAGLDMETLRKALAEVHSCLACKITGKINSSKLMKMDEKALDEARGYLEDLIVRKALGGNMGGVPKTVTKLEAVAAKIEQPATVTMMSEPNTISEPKPEKVDSSDLVTGRYRPINPSTGKRNPPPTRYKYVAYVDGKGKELSPQQAKQLVKMVMGEAEWNRRNVDLYGHRPLKNAARKFGAASVNLRVKGKMVVLKAIPITNKFTL